MDARHLLTRVTRMSKQFASLPGRSALLDSCFWPVLCIWFVWFLWFTWFIWFVSFDHTNQTDHTNKTDRPEMLADGAASS